MVAPEPSKKSGMIHEIGTRGPQMALSFFSRSPVCGPIRERNPATGMGGRASDLAISFARLETFGRTGIAYIGLRVLEYGNTVEKHPPFLD